MLKVFILLDLNLAIAGLVFSNLMYTLMYTFVDNNGILQLIYWVICDILNIKNDPVGE